MTRELQFVYGSMVADDGTAAVYIQFGDEKGTIPAKAANDLGAGLIATAAKAEVEAKVLRVLREETHFTEAELLDIFAKVRGGATPAVKAPPEKPAPAAPEPAGDDHEDSVLRALGEIRAGLASVPV